MKNDIRTEWGVMDLEEFLPTGHRDRPVAGDNLNIHITKIGLQTILERR